MDRKRKYFVASGGFKKKRKQFLKAFAAQRSTSRHVAEFVRVSETTNSELFDQCETSELVNVESIRNSTSENVEESVRILEATNSESLSPCETSDHEQISDVDQIEETSLIDNNSDSTPFNINHFQFKLASWAVTNKVNHDQLRGLLQIWNECIPLPHLPADPRTVLATPRVIHIENENYWHYGLKKSLDNIIQRIKNVPEKLSLKINFDGIPISKSSNTECWPILCELKELPKLQPFIIGIYCGPSML